MNPPSRQHYLQHGWAVITAFDHWLSERGDVSPLARGTCCKYIAFFFDVFLSRFYCVPDQRNVPLDRIRMDIVDHYLGDWYPRHADCASPADLRIQLDSLGEFTRFLHWRCRSRKQKCDLDRLASGLADRQRYQDRLAAWLDIRNGDPDDPEWQRRRTTWLHARW